jgi:hypothetical protein
MKHALASKGLSLSQAQSISNLCNQRSRDIQSNISVINNAEKTLKFEGSDYVKQVGNPMPANIVDLLTEKSRLHATQAFLMENIRAKDELLASKRRESMKFDKESPDSPDLHWAEELDHASEAWGWDQLTTAQWEEYLEAEAYASHIGQFIHKGGKLDELRKELPIMELLEWAEIETGKKTPVQVEKHHTLSELSAIHETLSGLHRQYEQRVNYFKAMVKNAVTVENARRERVNADEAARVNQINKELTVQYEGLRREWIEARKQAEFAFNESKQKDIEQIAALRIEVPARFQPVVDEFLKGLE